MVRVAIYGVLVLASAASLPFLSPIGRLFPVIAGVLVGAAFPLADVLVTSRRHLRLIWYSLRFRKTMIRVSVSYLLRIRVDGKYLLIRSARAPVFLPVGGVYKVTASAASSLSAMGVVSDSLIPIDAASQDDLRIRVPGSRLMEFMNWFESGKSREVGPWRELYEELVRPGLVSAIEFAWVPSEFLRRMTTPVRFSHHPQTQEIIVADIYELLPTATQMAALRALQHGGHADLVWVTEDQIRRRGAIPGAHQSLSIAEPVAQWII